MTEKSHLFGKKYCPPRLICSYRRWGTAQASVASVAGVTTVSESGLGHTLLQTILPLAGHSVEGPVCRLCYHTPPPLLLIHPNNQRRKNTYMCKCELSSIERERKISLAPILHCVNLRSAHAADLCCVTRPRPGFPGGRVRAQWRQFKQILRGFHLLKNFLPSLMSRDLKICLIRPFWVPVGVKRTGCFSPPRMG